MMWRHTLNDVEIDEPTGFDSIAIGPVRDEVNHGIGFEATQSALQFTGNGFQILNTANETTGLKSIVIYAVYSRCDENQEWDLVFTGRINFGSLRKTCGITCVISAPIETKSCEVVFNSRYDQQVDMDKNTGVDNQTALVKYDALGARITLPAVQLYAIDEARQNTDNTERISDQPTWDTPSDTVVRGYIAPRMETTLNSSLGTFSPPTFTQFFKGTENSTDPTAPVTVDTLTYNNNIQCTFTGVELNFRINGAHTLQASGGGETMVAKVIIYKIPNGIDIDDVANWDTEYLQPLSTVSSSGGTQVTTSFDFSDSIPVVVTQGDRFIWGVYVENSNAHQDRIQFYDFTVKSGTFFNMNAAATCEDSDTDYYMIHEALSHVVEEVTNGCLRVKSSYYGRVDSQPYDFPDNGCGGLRMVTSGLKIRNAENAKFFASAKDLIDNLRKVDNIGFDVYENDVRIESVDFFYQDVEILKCVAATKVDSGINEGGHYAKIIAGYKNWKTEKINGLNEFNSEREYKTSLDTISTTLDIQSEFVTGSLTIEATRQQSFAATGAADTTYDNNIFLITLRRADYPYSTFEVEQGNVSNPINIYSPSTIYNWRIRPVANMMRWFKTIATSYRNLIDPANKIYFSSGTGNIQAGGIMSDSFCRPEKNDTREDQSIAAGQVQNFSPLWINEIITFSYPLSLADYNRIKANPYGYVSVQCGEGDWLRGYINEIRYRPVKGDAQFTLKRKP